MKFANHFQSVAQLTLIAAVSGSLMASPALSQNVEPDNQLNLSHALQEHKGAPLDDLFVAAGHDWSQWQSASISIVADFDADRGMYRLDERETDQLIEDFEEELTSQLGRRADITASETAPGGVAIELKITDVSVNLPQSARYAVRSQTFSRQRASLEVEGVIKAPGSSTVIATFSDRVDYEDPFFTRSSPVSVRSDLAEVASMSAKRLARSIATLKN